jgi:nitrogen fixation protein FixH
MKQYATLLPGARRSHWIPWAFVAFFGVVLAANGIMIVVALATWPGLQTEHAYQRGLASDEALQAAAAQAALGWRVGFAFEQIGQRAGTVRLDLADRFGNTLQDATVRVAFVRPTHDGYDRQIELPHYYGGRYLDRIDLPLSGQWEAQVHVLAAEGEYRLRQRIYLKP